MKIPPAFDAKLTKIFSVIKIDEPLALHTTIGVGGPAARLVTATTAEQLQQGLQLAYLFNLPVFVLGWGSNLIVSDHGFPGLVIKNRAQHWQVIEELPPVKNAAEIASSTSSRLACVGEDYYQIDDLMYSEASAPSVIVQVESGAKIDPLMKALFRHGLTGLQWFAGIPATVGGAVYMNMHGGYHFFGDMVERALLFESQPGMRSKSEATVSPHGGCKQVTQAYFQFEYDRSILQQTKETVLWAQLRLFRGDVQRARATAREWARRKALQPQRSAGCIFRNLTLAQQKQLNLPTPSLGYLVEHVLKLKGTRRGEAVISPRHAAFIENLGQARAQEVKELIDLIKTRARAELALELEEEIEYLGEF
ncbi:MAG: FAD-binding protein [candidate division KSB1 bacterium]|nr:FAD-binding protein [candidate division KSB1 bacterium]